MGTTLILCLVWIVCISHGALIAHEFPRSRHPAATTTSHSIVLVEHIVILLSASCAINTLLFREAFRNLFVVYADGSLKGRCCCECPAGTAGTLRLDWGHILGVVYCFGLSDTEHASSKEGKLLIVRCFFFFVFFTDETKNTLVLCLCPI